MELDASLTDWAFLLDFLTKAEWNYKNDGYDYSKTLQHARTTAFHSCPRLKKGERPLPKATFVPSVNLNVDDDRTNKRSSILNKQLLDLCLCVKNQESRCRRQPLRLL